MNNLKNLVIIGAGGHGRVVAEIAQKSGKYSNIYFIDDFKTGKCMDIDILGKVEDIESLKLSNTVFFVAIGDNTKRKEIFEFIREKNYEIITLIHSNAIVSDYSKIGRGCVVMAGAVVGNGTVIGDGVIVNTNSCVDHDCVIGEFSHVSIGANIAGTVVVGERAFIGAGVSIINNITISSGAIIGAGAAVVKDIIEKATYVGIPAKKI